MVIHKAGKEIVVSLQLVKTLTQVFHALKQIPVIRQLRLE
jgi:hypothetical protein